MMARTLRPPDMNPEGITPTEWVRRIGRPGAGLVEEINGDHATVAFGGKREVVPLVCLQRVKMR